jgi:hypothetical protein
VGHIRKMLDSSSVLLSKMEKHFKDMKESEQRLAANSHDKSADDDDNDLPEFLQVPTKEEFEHFTLPFYFDRQTDKYGRKFFMKQNRKIGADIDIRPSTRYLFFFFF